MPALDELLRAAGVTTDVDLIERLPPELHVSRKTISRWRARGYADATWIAAARRALQLESTDVVHVPLLLQPVGAGKSIAGDDHVESLMPIPRALLDSISPRNAVVMRVSGDSMAPTIESGDLVLVRRYHAGEQLSDGAIYVVRHDGWIMLRRLRAADRKTIKLDADNPQTASMLVRAAEIEIIGIVIARIYRQL